MDHQSSPNVIRVFDPTAIITAALTLKGASWVVCKDRTSLADIQGPALQFRHITVVGEAGILGWLDRRYPFPELFPGQLELYGRAATIAHALSHQPDAATELYTALTDAGADFLTGRDPNIADLALSAALDTIEHPEAPSFHARLAAYAAA